MERIPHMKGWEREWGCAKELSWRSVIPPATDTGCILPSILHSKSSGRNGQHGRHESNHSNPQVANRTARASRNRIPWRVYPWKASGASVVGHILVTSAKSRSRKTGVSIYERHSRTPVESERSCQRHFLVSLNTENSNNKKHAARSGKNLPEEKKFNATSFDLRSVSKSEVHHTNAHRYRGVRSPQHQTSKCGLLSRATLNGSTVTFSNMTGVPPSIVVRATTCHFQKEGAH